MYPLDFDISQTIFFGCEKLFAYTDLCSYILRSFSFRKPDMYSLPVMFCPECSIFFFFELRGFQNLFNSLPINDYPPSFFEMGRHIYLRVIEVFLVLHKIEQSKGVIALEINIMKIILPYLLFVLFLFCQICRTASLPSTRRFPVFWIAGHRTFYDDFFIFSSLVNN